MAGQGYCSISVNKREIDFGKELKGNTVLREVCICNEGEVAGSFLIASYSGNKGTTENTYTENKEIQDTTYDIAGFSIEGIRVGFLKPGCSKLVKFKFQPQFIGPVSSDFVISSPGCDDIIITCKAECIEGSISLQTTIIDFKTCLFNSTYQESIVVTNRQNSSKMIKCKVPRELSENLRLIPRKMLVQAGSSFAFQVKFLPCKRLISNASMYFDKDTSVFETTVSVKVDDEPDISVAMLAVVTDDDVAVSPKCIDFGVCTTCGKVRVPVSITNESLLPQDVSFVDLPTEIEADSIVSRLGPLETAVVNLLFEPTRDCLYNFNLRLKNRTNRTFSIKCTGRGKTPSLKLSHQVLFFRATAPGDVSEHVLTISNETCSNHLFEFGTNGDVPIHFYPKVGLLLPNQQSLIKIFYEPNQSNDEEVQMEAVRLRNQNNPLRSLKSESENLEVSDSHEEETPQVLSFSDQELISARLSLLGCEERICSIPCFVASEINGIPVLKSEETLFVEVHFRTCTPELLVVSDDGRNVVDFGDVLVGLSLTKVVAIRNISSNDIEPKASCLGSFGDFELVGALRTIHSRETQNLRIKFTPTCPVKYYEEFGLGGGSSNLKMIFKGRGCSPHLKISLDNGCLDFGRVMVGEVVEEILKLTNDSLVKIAYDAVISCCQQDHTKVTRNVLEIFDCTPSRGILEAGSSKEIKVTFRSNLEGRHHCSTFQIISNDKVVLSFQGKARTEPHTFHISGLETQDELNGNFTLFPSEDEEVVPLVMKIKRSNKERCFHIGCSRISKNSNVKKNIDWSMESTQDLLGHGFIVSPVKGSVESGGSEKISVSWKPNFHQKKEKLFQSVATLTLRGDITKTYKIFLFGIND